MPIDKSQYSKAELSTAKRKSVAFKQWIDKTLDNIVKNGLLVDFIDIEKRYMLKGLENKPDCVFTMSYQKKYRMGTLCIYPMAYDLYEEGKTDELTYGLTHEMAHIYTIPVAELSRTRFASETELMDAFEELTQIISEYMKRGMKTN